MFSLNDGHSLNSDKKSSCVKSLKKALAILEYFTSEEPEWGISDLSRITGLYKSNIYNILSTFEAAGYLEKNNISGKYRLGLKFLDKSYVVSNYFTNFNIIHEALQKLSQNIPEIIYYGILNQNNVMYLDAILPSSSHALRFVNGMTAPLHCTGLGKALLSGCDDKFVRSVLSSPDIKKYTEATIVDCEEMIREIHATRDRGYAIDNMEHEYGIKCVAVPIFDHRGNLSGAISACGPSLRFTDDTILKYARLLQHTATELKGAL